MNAVGTWTVRPEREGDFLAVRELVASAFAGKPYSSGTEHVIVDALRSAGADSVSLVADEDGGIIGQIMFSPVAINGEPSNWHALGPVAAAVGRQGRGVGSALIGEGLETLRRMGSAGCILVGEPGYYRRFGFRHSTKMKVLGYDDAYFLVLPFGPEEPVGIVSFHPAFD